MFFLARKIKTVLRYVGESWRNAPFIVEKNPRTNRLSAWFSLMYWFYFYGNDFNDYCTFSFWDKSHAQRASYISLRRNDRLRFALSTPRIHSLFLDKGAFNRRFAGYIRRRWIVCRESSLQQLHDFLAASGSIIAKPLDDFGGHGVFKTDCSRLSPDELNALARRLHPQNFIVEECIENVEAIKRIAPGSLNTIRIVTVIDRNRHLNVLAALLRMGNGKAVTDNYHDGGMACAIDPATGRLRGNAFGMNCAQYETHPHSGIRFDGFEVPRFRECLDMLTELTAVEPEARYVGWDFAVTPDGIELLEGNIPPGEDITQIAARRGLWHEVKAMI